MPLLIASYRSPVVTFATKLWFCFALIRVQRNLSQARAEQIVVIRLLCCASISVFVSPCSSDTGAHGRLHIPSDTALRLQTLRQSNHDTARGFVGLRAPEDQG